MHRLHFKSSMVICGQCSKSDNVDMEQFNLYRKFYKKRC